MRETVKFTHLSTAESTHPGLCRPRNEDAIIRMPEAGVFCVADGIGGASVGDEASATAVDCLARAFRNARTHPAACDFEFRKALVRDAMNRASRTIRSNCVRNHYRTSGTTAVTMVFDPLDPGRAAVLHAGDSRAYRIRGGRLEQLTVDHSMPVEQGFPDEHAWIFGMRTVITRAVGVRSFVELEETEIDVCQDDLFLLCSDGLTNMVDDEKISRLIRSCRGRELEHVVETLIAEANHAGGQDNITVLLVRIEDEVAMRGRFFLQQSPWAAMLRRLGRWKQA